MRVIPVITALLLGLCRVAAAMEPPPGPVPGGRGPGIDPALAIGNLEFSPALVSRYAGTKGPNLLSFRDKGLPSTGSPKILVLLIDFDDYPARLGDTPEALREKIFGGGGKVPYESLSAYYRRSSYGRLNIGGDVAGWFRAGKRADVPQTREGREAIIKQALLALKKRDFSQYDSDGDGVIDYMAVVWTGPIGEWATFWWAVAPRFSDSGFTAGGLRLGSYAWQGVVSRWDDPAAEFQTNILVHETGHALGLPDYYDYNPDVGPKGGLGHMDIMDANRLDHNCFSKMMLGWVEPRVVTAGGQYLLRPANEAGDCLLLVPSGRKPDPFGEYFLVETRRPAGNDYDQGLTKGGVVVWHVDARLNERGTNFLYNNSNTEHKLLRIMEADGLEELESGASSSFTFLDFYQKGASLGPATVPSSRLYDGTDTGISLVSRGGESEVSFSVSFK